MDATSGHDDVALSVAVGKPVGCQGREIVPNILLSVPLILRRSSPFNERFLNLLEGVAFI